MRGFSAADGTIQLPAWLARALHVDQRGAKVFVEALPADTLPAADFCRLRATDPRFLALPNARAVLETALSTRFRTLTKVRTMKTKGGVKIYSFNYSINTHNIPLCHRTRSFRSDIWVPRTSYM